MADDNSTDIGNRAPAGGTGRSNDDVTNWLNGPGSTVVMVILAVLAVMFIVRIIQVLL